jgi:hypothetical protein
MPILSANQLKHECHKAEFSGIAGALVASIALN